MDNDPKSSDYKSTLENKQILQNVTDALGNSLAAVPLNTPDFSAVRAAVTSRNGWSSDSSNFNSDVFAASYVGFYVGEKYVLMAQYGDPQSDHAAFKALQNVFRDKLVVQITTDGISNGGGTIHCSTQQQTSGAPNKNNNGGKDTPGNGGKDTPGSGGEKALFSNSMLVFAGALAALNL
ncbi:hypothetical protein GQ42DRAFT_7057 [Ramicandelaber brevisporus]|nr:hypothetical protein GQ42DRAFT_7057 [Ramicandelaber brevisporus]